MLRDESILKFVIGFSRVYVKHDVNMYIKIVFEVKSMSQKSTVSILQL